MKKNNLNRGIAPLVIVLIVVIALAVGGGAYYSSQNRTSEVENDANTNTNANADINGEAATTADISAEVKTGSLRSLLALGRDVKCTIDGSTSGTVYISGTMMRGDFTTTSSGSGGVESHMIRQGDMAYVWQGSQGAKMNMSAMSSNSSSAQNKNSVNLDQDIDYQCENWSKDASRFTPPTTVNFIDLQAMMQAGGNVQIPAGI